MDRKLILEYIFSQRLFLLLLVFIPFVLSIAFGNILYSHDRLGKTYLDDGKIPTESGTYFKGERNETNNEREQIYNEKLDVEKVTPLLNASEKKRYYSSFYSSSIQLSKLCLIIGGIAAALTGVTWVSEGHIIYYISNKQSKERAFLEFFSYPLSFLILISLISTFGIMCIVLRAFPYQPTTELFLISFFMIFFGILEGYILGLGVGVLTQNTLLPIVLPATLVFSTPIFDSSENITLPYKPFLFKSFADMSISNSYWVLGILLLASSLALVYVAFKWGDFYQ